MSENKINNPLISIVTVVYNSFNTLKATIESVLNQSYQSIEFVIIDGGSTDGSLDIINEYSNRITKWVSEPDKGIYDAMNKAVKKCTGNWVYFIGADDVLMSNTIIEQLVGKIGRSNEIIYGDVVFKNANLKYDGEFKAWKIVTRNICHQSIFYPLAIFEAFSFNTNYKVYADYHLNLILFNDKRWKFKHVPLIIACFNDGGLSGSKANDENFRRDMHRIIRDNFSLIIYLYRCLRSGIALLIKRR